MRSYRERGIGYIGSRYVYLGNITNSDDDFMCILYGLLKVYDMGNNNEIVQCTSPKYMVKCGKRSVIYPQRDLKSIDFFLSL